MIGKSKLFRKVWVPLRNLIVGREKVGRTEWLQKEKLGRKIFLICKFCPDCVGACQRNGFDWPRNVRVVRRRRLVTQKSKILVSSRKKCVQSTRKICFDNGDCENRKLFQPIFVSIGIVNLFKLFTKWLLHIDNIKAKRSKKNDDSEPTKFRKDD